MSSWNFERYVMKKLGVANRAAARGYLPVLGAALAGLLTGVVPLRVRVESRTLDVSQYAHTAWKVGENLPQGAIESIAQTPDGYLWLGTEFGLLRFDGVRNLPWPSSLRLPSGPIRSLLAARDGTLWIGATKGLASWKDGKLTRYPQLAGHHYLGRSLRIVKASSGPAAGMWCPPEDFARFRMGAPDATERMAVLARQFQV